MGMIYKKHNYSWVNEKEKGGILYTAWRCDDQPDKCLITYEDQVVETEELKKDWEALG
jgi:hypothetical protein